MTDTVYAPATASGQAGIAVIRVSGPLARFCMEGLIGGLAPPPRQATRRRIRDPETGELLDVGLVLWFPGPGSFTGEDVAEFHIHGGRATVTAVCGTLSQIEGCRLAAPGEFSRRAFDNEKLDLTEVEGLADLISAETEAQRRQALRQFGGALGDQLATWREMLVRGLALMEADLDFPEEGLPDYLEIEIDKNILMLRKEITEYLNDHRRGELIREGIFIAIVGAPNVGKSSLLNILAQRDIVIVSETAGTTRDIVEVSLDLGGYAVTIADTAGLRDSEDVIEQEGVRRAFKHAEKSDLCIVVFDASRLELDPQSLSLLGPKALPLFNKLDLSCNERVINRIEGAIGVSAKTEENIELLIDRLTERVSCLISEQNAQPPTRLRHREALTDCVKALDRASAADMAELKAEDLRLATRALGRITGNVDVEHILDIIFAEFCIGK